MNDRGSLAPSNPRSPLRFCVVSADRTADLTALDATLISIEKVLDVPRLRIELSDLEAQAGEPDLWNDTVKAQEITTRLSTVQSDIQRVEG